LEDLLKLPVESMTPEQKSHAIAILRAARTSGPVLKKHIAQSDEPKTKKASKSTVNAAALAAQY
jgi:hypothetical protein